MRVGKAAAAEHATFIAYISRLEKQQTNTIEYVNS